MENETKTAGLRGEATDPAFKKEGEKLSLFEKIYFSVFIISLLTTALITGSIIAEIIFRIN